MLETIITALLPIIVTISLGYFAGNRQEFTQDQASALNRMVMLYALPMMLFAGILSIPMSEVTRSLDIFLWIFIGMVCVFFIVFFICFFILKNAANVAALRSTAIATPSVPFVGTAVLTVLFKVEAPLAIATSSLLMNLFMVPFTLIFLVGSGNKKTQQTPIQIMFGSIKNAIKQPVIWAPISAGILLFSGLDLPKALQGSFMLLGHATSGVALFTIGVVLYAQKVSISLPVIVNVLCKNIVIPATILILMIAMSVPTTERSLVAITLSIPTASISVIFAVEYKVLEQEMASTLFLSTVFSIFTMAGFIFITGI